MDIHNLIKMANQIGQFFEAWPDGEEMREEIATHLRRFWDPRMRRRLAEHVAEGGEGLSAPVCDAVRRLDAPAR